jgi:hypothetical protein
MWDVDKILKEADPVTKSTSLTGIRMFFVEKFKLKLFFSFFLQFKLKEMKRLN